MTVDELAESFDTNLAHRIRALGELSEALKDSGEPMAVRMPTHLALGYFEQVGQALGTRPIEVGTVERMMPSALTELRAAIKLRPEIDKATDGLLNVAKKWLTSFKARQMGPDALGEALRHTLRAVARGEAAPKVQVVEGDTITERKSVPNYASVFLKGSKGSKAVIVTKRGHLELRTPNPALTDRLATSAVATLKTKAAKALPQVKQRSSETQTFTLSDGVKVTLSRFEVSLEPAEPLTMGALTFEVSSKTRELDDVRF